MSGVSSHSIIRYYHILLSLYLIWFHHMSSHVNVFCHFMPFHYLIVSNCICHINIIYYISLCVISSSYRIILIVSYFIPSYPIVIHLMLMYCPIFYRIWVYLAVSVKSTYFIISHCLLSHLIMSSRHLIVLSSLCHISVLLIPHRINVSYLIPFYLICLNVFCHLLSYFSEFVYLIIISSSCHISSYWSCQSFISLYAIASSHRVLSYDPHCDIYIIPLYLIVSNCMLTYSIVSFHKFYILYLLSHHLTITSHILFYFISLYPISVMSA